jgi:hypothetical protein
MNGCATNWKANFASADLGWVEACSLTLIQRSARVVLADLCAFLRLLPDLR